MNHRFVVPALDGPPTGGTLFNRRLVDALRSCGDDVRVGPALQGDPGFLWVDTLLLDEVMEGKPAHRWGLLTHYLPALVRHGATPGRAQLSSAESFALQHAAAFVVPSLYLKGELEALGVRPELVGVVEPGVSPGAGVRPRASGPGARACVVANLLPGKGVLWLVSRLSADAPASWHVDVVGSATMDPEYAGQCHRAATAARCTVVFHGSCSPSGCLEIIAGSDVLISASSMESYGMAIADAQACGVPVVALAGGNVSRLVSAEHGGELARTPEALVTSLLELGENPALLATRQEKARFNLRTRSWAAAAEDFRAFAERINA